MANFTPPLRATQINAPYDVDAEPLVKRCMGHFKTGSYGVGVFILKDDGAGGVGNKVTEVNPIGLYTNGKLTTLASDRILYFFQGNATYTDIPSDAATLLTAAGYTLS